MPNLPNGTSTAVWRVTSADGHEVSGGFQFSVGNRSGTKQSFATLSRFPSSGPAVQLSLGASRFTQFAAIAVALGTVVFLLSVWIPVSAGNSMDAIDSEARRSISNLLLVSAAIGGIASAAGLAAQGALASGGGIAKGFRPETIHEVLGTRFGTVWLLAMAAWASVAALAPLIRSGSRRAMPLALPLGFVAAVPALAGHATARSPSGLLGASNVIHVFAISVWIGGVVTLLVVVLPGSRRSGIAGMRRTAAAVSKFSPIALASVGTVLATGVLQAILTLDPLSSLFESAYGRTVVAKAGLLACLIALGAVQRRKVIPRLTDGNDPQRALGLAQRTLLKETVVFAMALAATAALAAWSPNATVASGPVSRVGQAGGTELQLVLDPAKIGPNSLHLLLIDSRSGQPFVRPIEVTVSASLPSDRIGPLNSAAVKAGPGHWIVQGLTLPAAGNWRLDVTARTSEFDELTYSVDGVHVT